MLSFALNLPFPPVMTSAARVAAVSNLDVFSVVPIGCAFAVNSDNKLLFYTLFLLVTGALVLAFVSPRRHHLRRDREASLHVIDRRRNGVVVPCGQEFLDFKAKSRLFKILRAYLSVLTFIIPSVTSVIFSTFSCIDLDNGESWLMTDKSINCNDAGHKALVVYALVMVGVICVGAPGGCFLLLWKNRAQIKQPLEVRLKNENLRYFDFLFDAYKPEYWYWEIIEMVRRIFMTGFLVVLVRGSYEQIVVCLLVRGSARSDERSECDKAATKSCAKRLQLLGFAGDSRLGQCSGTALSESAGPLCVASANTFPLR